MTKIKYKEDDIKNHCKGCGNDGTWFGKILTYDLYHIDRNINNNSIYNIQLFCPNCHSVFSKNKKRLHKIFKFHQKNKEKKWILIVLRIILREN